MSLMRWLPILRRWYEWNSSLRAIGHEYRAARFAVDRLVREIQRDHGILPGDVQAGHLTDAQQFLEGTYVVRMFSEFETDLRSFWETVRDSNPPMIDLVNGVASRKRIEFDISDAVHRVRVYRNFLVHERDEDIAPISLKSVESYLTQYLRRMKEW